jgi:putative transcriptional regulator
MQVLEMPVRSRLKLLIAERNVERLKRGEQPLTTRQVAEGSGLGHSTVTGLTSGRASMVAFDTISALCAFFDVQPGELFEYYDDDQAVT